MKKLFILGLTALVLSGCNTVSGIGKDVKAAGQAVQNVGGK
ncbi:MAG TPA: entericidin A/B family lipoprotein [Janthinobacterium sp.]|jgi:predicted small secreted protein|nr:entericidin A/B family lipoprotein [Janthinobacterium sp.]